MDVSYLFIRERLNITLFIGFSLNSRSFAESKHARKSES